MERAERHLAAFAREVSGLAADATSNEGTFYPAIQALLNGLLRDAQLPFEARILTSQRRAGGGADQPDLALYEGEGSFPVVFGEVKTPRADLEELAFSTEHNDQVGRYLGQVGVVLLSNVRSFGLLATTPGWKEEGPVPPEHRRLLDVVEVWPSATALRQGRPPATGAATGLAELVETAVTEFAPIGEPESLARVLARQARRAKAGLPAQFTQAVRPLLDDFAKALGLHFVETEGEEFLRSSLIQTAFYGLFAGWTLWRQAGAERPFRWEDLAEHLKIPFLGELFHEFRHPQRLRELGLATHLDSATATLGRVDQDRFFARFQMPQVRPGSDLGRAAASSAILYFYEPFLEAFDPELRKQLGVWYTPQAIVHYQVRKVERLLREELGCERGFADERVVVLDPCCGTGAYLIEVLRCVAEQLEEEGVGGLLGSKLLDAFCRRIVGFEVLTAPFVVAQLQLYLILADLGVEPDPDHRPAIFLTNALTGWEGPEQLKLQFPELQQEHDGAQRVKREERIIVMLGNPPYNRFAGVPLDEEADLVDHYKGITRNAKGKQVGQTKLYERFGVRKQLLDDLYIRFFRLADKRIGELAEYGIVSFISNSSYLNGRSHPLMRESLLRNFHTIWIDNLHGNRLASERTPWGESCETVFNTQAGPGIKVGTCISTFLKRREEPTPPEGTLIFARDFWGQAELKRSALSTAMAADRWSEPEWAQAAGRPEGPREYEEHRSTERNRYSFLPRESAGGYEDWPALDELFPASFQGVNPNRGLEGSLIDTDRQVLERRMRDYFSKLPFSNLRGSIQCSANPAHVSSPRRSDPFSSGKARSRAKPSSAISCSPLTRDTSITRTKPSF